MKKTILLASAAFAALSGAAEIAVADTGVGIAPEALPRLGRPFEQIDSPLENGNKGSGLGLAIARSLVELHGGWVALQSEPGHGSTFTCHLPEIAHDSTGRPELQF